MQKPLAPSSEQRSLSGNGNSSKLWDQEHLSSLVTVLVENKFTDGLKFILSCEQTHEIYNGMSMTRKLGFLSRFLSKETQDNITDIEIREILKLKLTEEPYATLAIFTMIQVDQEAFEASTMTGRGVKPQEKKQAQSVIK